VGFGTSSAWNEREPGARGKLGARRSADLGAGLDENTLAQAMLQDTDLLRRARIVLSVNAPRRRRSLFRLRRRSPSRVAELRRRHSRSASTPLAYRTAQRSPRGLAR